MPLIRYSGESKENRKRSPAQLARDTQRDQPMKQDKRWTGVIMMAEASLVLAAIAISLVVGYIASVLGLALEGEESQWWVSATAAGVGMVMAYNGLGRFVYRLCGVPDDIS